MASEGPCVSVGDDHQTFLGVSDGPGPAQPPELRRQRADYNACNWEEANARQSGFATAWTPDRRTPRRFGSQVFNDVDLIAIREEEGGPAFAAITARSYHLGGVNVLMGDGSVRFIKDTGQDQVWRALGTIADREVSSGDNF